MTEAEKQLIADIKASPALSLQANMTALIMWVWAKLPEYRSDCDEPPYNHYMIFHAAAREFNLYDPETNLAPIWLSRVVSGVISDAHENGEKSFNI